MARVILLAALIAVAGCGFKLRSYSFDGNVASYAITGQLRAQIVPILRRTLRQLDVAETNADEAALVVEVLDQRSERRSVSTAGQARAAEYEIDYGVRYQILDGEGGVLAPPVWIQRQRVYQIDRGNIVGSSEEQSILQQELLNDIAGQIVRAMDLVSRQTPESG